LTSALEETDRLARLAQDLLTLARADAGQLAPGDARTELLASVRAGVRRLPPKPAVEIEIQGEPTYVRGDEEWLEHIVTNLVGNACRHASSRVLVTVRVVGRQARLEVADDGAGFSPELLPRVFDRFARSDSQRGSGGGAGLGLAIVASITQAVGGTVSATNGEPLGGARVEVSLLRSDRGGP